MNCNNNICCAALACLMLAPAMPGAPAAYAARPSRPKGKALTAAQYLEKAREAFEAYDFDEAASLAASARRVAKTDDETAEAEVLADEIRLGENFLGRVEKIVILDSIAVPKEAFFNAYRLPSSAGTLATAAALPTAAADSTVVDYVFTNEGNNFKIWAEPDTTGYYRLMESNLLTNGKWSAPHPSSDALGEGGNAEWPFMMPDGVTLYYASDGDGSMGGYDIFVATRDAQTGEYLQPQNMGMPYNSPFDDYLLAIDEENGVGWWATDRNQLDDNITVYLFKTNDLRVNHDPDDDGIVDAARIADFKGTWGDNDWSELASNVMRIRPEVRKKRDFTMPMGKGVVYTSLDDFKTSAGRTAMTRYLEAVRHFDESMTKLSGLRRKYHAAPSRQGGDAILKLEKWAESERARIAKLRSDVYRAERR